MTYYLLFILSSKNVLTVSYIYLMNSFSTPIFSFHPHRSPNETLFLNKSPCYVHIIFLFVVQSLMEVSCPSLGGRLLTGIGAAYL